MERLLRFFYRRATDGPAESSAAQVASSAAAAFPPTVPPSERLAIAVQELRAAAKAAEAEETAREWGRVAEAGVKVEKAEKFVRDTHIGRALCRVLSEIWHFPSWSKNNPADFEQRWKSLNVADISGDEIKERDITIKTISFRAEVHKYQFRLVELGSSLPDCDTKFANIFLDYDGQQVFGIDASRPLHEDYNRWHPMGVIALKPGDWVAALVLWEEKLGARAKGATRDFQTKRMAERGSSIDI